MEHELFNFLYQKNAKQFDETIKPFKRISIYQYSFLFSLAYTYS